MAMDALFGANFVDGLSDEQQDRLSKALIEVLSDDPRLVDKVKASVSTQVHRVDTDLSKKIAKFRPIQGRDERFRR